MLTAIASAEQRMCVHQQHMFAGGVAGITEHIAMYPVDTIKTRMQALAHPGQQVSNPLHVLS